MRKGLHIIRAMFPEVDVSANQRCPLTDTHDREGREYSARAFREAVAQAFDELDRFNARFFDWGRTNWNGLP
jgi:hypothetical protein